MDFASTLDFIMNITITTNSMLAKHASLDPSFISRLRNGSRTPSKNENYLETISIFLAKRFEQDYQKECLKNKFSIPIDNLDMNESMLQMLILNLLSVNAENKNHHVSSFIKELDQFSFKKERYSHGDFLVKKSDLEENLFYGLSGKREAVLTFLTNIIEAPEPMTLLLYSDEDMEWLLGDLAYAQKWAHLFSKVISMGHKIKIIHTLNRSIDDIFNAIRIWMPFYMTGSIEPYYYPRNRDGVFRRTLFIGPKSCALTSNSVGTNVGNSTNFIFYDEDVINNLTLEFNDYLALCKPLMKIFSSSITSSFRNTISEFEAESGDALLKSSSLSSLSMPLFVIEKIAKEMEDTYKYDSLEYHKTRLKALEKYLKKNILTEIITLPSYDDIRDRKIQIPTTSFSGIHDFFYDKFSYKAQLENIIRLLKEYKNYHLIISDIATDDLTIYVKENVGLIIMKYTCPPISFAINESYMTNAFWDYLSLIKPSDKWDNAIKKKTIERLENYIKGLADL